ncbi:MAG: TetR/AcrR family transcriptional regulator [Microthrixaceae bacterium]
MSSPAPNPDGRVARGERTRAAIIEAFVDLVDDGVARPRARQIAERAGVSVRSIFQHFEDLDGVRADVVRLQARRIRPMLEDLTTDGELPERIAALVEQRARLYEFITPMRRTMESAGRSGPTDRGLRDLDDRLRAQVAEQFAPELRRRERAERQDLLAALDTWCSFPTWDHLRRANGRSVLQSRRSVRLGLERLLA